MLMVLVNLLHLHACVLTALTTSSAITSSTPFESPYLAFENIL